MMMGVLQLAMMVKAISVLDCDVRRPCFRLLLYHLDLRDRALNHCFLLLLHEQDGKLPLLLLMERTRWDLQEAE